MMCYGLCLVLGPPMRRRDFITLVGGAAAVWPVAARAQQPAMPVVGFLRPTRAEEAGHLVAAVRQGLRESGYTNDKVVIEARWANGQMERLPRLAAELVTLKVAVIVASFDAALAAKKATESIPIIFLTGADPVAAGLVGGGRAGSNTNTLGRGATDDNRLDAVAFQSLIKIVAQEFVGPARFLIDNFALARRDAIINDFAAAGQAYTR